MKTISTSTGAFQIEKNKDTYNMSFTYSKWSTRLLAAANVLFKGETPNETIDFVQAKKIANSLTFRPYVNKKGPSSKSQE